MRLSRLSGLSRLSRLSGLAVMAVAATAATAIAADAPVKSVGQLLGELHSLAYDKSVAFEAVTNAYAEVTSRTNINANQRFSAAKEFLTFHLNRGKLRDALAFAEAMSSEKDIPPQRRAELFMTVAQSFAKENMADRAGSYRHDGFDRASEIYARILDIPDVTDESRIAAYNGMANMALEATRDVPAAFALLDKAIALQGLNAEQKARARLNRAELHRRLREYDKALAIVQPIVADESLPDNVRKDAMSKAFSIAKSTGGLEGELKARRDVAAKYPKFQSEDDLARFCTDTGADIPFAVAYYHNAVADWTPESRTRFPALNMVRKAFSSDGFDTCAKEMPAVMAKIAGSSGMLSDLFRDMTWRFAGKILEDPRYPELVFSLFDSVPATNRPSAVRLFEYASKHKSTYGRAVDYARQTLAIPEDAKKAPSKKQRNEAAAFVAVADAKGDPSRAVALLDDYLAKKPPADNLERAACLLKGVNFAMFLRQDDVAKALYAEREKLVKKEEPRSIPCPYIANAPQDISEILRSDFYKKGVKGLADRKFGDDLKFIIETDVTANRTMTEFNGKPFRPTEIFAFCDQNGVKVLVRQFGDAETLAKYRNGFGGFGGYEAYIAPSFDGPYAFIGFSPATTKLEEGFTSQYDNSTGYRNLKGSDNSASLSHYVAEDSVVSLLSFAWYKEFANLPSNGDMWYFEPICWSNGGWTWGGSKSVHNRSNFGALVFEGITPAAAAAIRRGILPKASSTFGNALSPRYNGCLEFWKDPELGDPAFYEECIKPLVDRLRPYQSRVKPDMTDAEVMDVYEKVAKEWMNIEFIVSHLRQRYLERKLIGEAD